LANTLSGHADQFVQKFGLNLQSTISSKLWGNVLIYTQQITGCVLAKSTKFHEIIIFFSS
ncbi:hypothetical protein, partial [Lactiplantibacillus plantarum]|uniref:hypothetical protein n=1 Tax=Lactiplantibacillus plantarum TaxID=1590 RepID=UPI003965A72F